jgi:YegS/Rv2252/BmrU family lipid kinase
MEFAGAGLKKIVYIMNPVSGSGKQRGIEKIVASETDPSKVAYSVIMTDRAGQAEELSRAAALGGAEIVVAVGGDGTVNEVARGIFGTGTALGIVPTGSGNGLARHLQLPLNFREAVRILNRGKMHTIDTVTLNGRLFVSLAGVGFDALVAKKFAGSSRRGFIGYARIAIPAYFSYRPKKYKIIADGQEFIRKALFIAFANSNQFGSNGSIDPVAELDDGLIDVCIVRKIPFFVLAFVAPAFFLKQFHKTPYVEIIRAKEVLLTRKRGKKIHLDGDPWKTEKELHVKIQPLSLQVIVP